MSFMINYIVELDTCDVYEYNEIALITFVMAYSITWTHTLVMCMNIMILHSPLWSWAYSITWMHRHARIAQKNKFHGKGPNDISSNLYNKSKIKFFFGQSNHVKDCACNILCHERNDECSSTMDESNSTMESCNPVCCVWLQIDLPSWPNVLGMVLVQLLHWKPE
jgi:hypothetical protein